MKCEKNIINQIELIVREIALCRDCSFTKENKNFFLPALPSIPKENELKQFKTMVIGTNPGLDENYQICMKNLFEEKNGNFDQIKLEYTSCESSTVKSYQRTLTEIVNTIRHYLPLAPQAIVPCDIYKYVYWANLSFCASKNLCERKLCAQELICRVLDEEIPNCLSHKYLQRFINVMTPLLIILFTYSYSRDYNTVLQGVFSNDYHVYGKPYKKPFIAYSTKKGKDIYTTLEIVPIEYNGNNKAYAFFLPHPRFPFKNRAQAVSNILSSFLKK